MVITPILRSSSCICTCILGLDRRYLDYTRPHKPYCTPYMHVQMWRVCVLRFKSENYFFASDSFFIFVLKRNYDVTQDFETKWIGWLRSIRVSANKFRCDPYRNDCWVLSICATDKLKYIWYMFFNADLPNHTLHIFDHNILVDNLRIFTGRARGCSFFRWR